MKIYQIDDKAIFIDKIYKLCDEFKTTELAKKLNVTPNAINHWLNGRRKPTSENIEKILKEFNLTLKDIGATIREEELQKEQEPKEENKQKRIFSDRLDELLKKNNVNQKDLAKAINISESLISKYRSGERNPSIDTLEKIANYFNVSLDYLTASTQTSDDFLVQTGLTLKAFNVLTNIVNFEHGRTVGFLFENKELAPMNSVKVVNYIIEDKSIIEAFNNESIKIYNYYNQYANIPSLNKKLFKQNLEKQIQESSDFICEIIKKVFIDYINVNVKGRNIKNDVSQNPNNKKTKNDDNK